MTERRNSREEIANEWKSHGFPAYVYDELDEFLDAKDRYYGGDGNGDDYYEMARAYDLVRTTAKGVMYDLGRMSMDTFRRLTGMLMD